ncbi:UvrD-helicase domain-containing protein [Halioglobus sp.]|nr:UvrD-helicase domain-containing protein [Halioglobus sp.]
MTLPDLTVVPAGAGSGKTHRIKEDLGQWVVDKKVAPEKILAVTFTEAAAAELKDRIRRKLLELGRLEDALLLDQAYISTIHSFGLRVITEFAFDSGQCPQPRLLTEDEQDILIRQALARTEKAEKILADLVGYGYRYSFNTGKSAADQFREAILDVVALLRTIGWCPDKPCDMAQIKNWIAERYGAIGNGRKVTAALETAVGSLLHAFPAAFSGVTGVGNGAATKDFRENYRDLRLAQTPGELEHNWALWQRLRKLRTGGQGCDLPADYIAKAEAVMAAAEPVVTHPGPLAHAQDHIEALLGTGEEVLSHYAHAKTQAGLVDYTDMIALADKLLQDRPDVLAELASRIDCVVVDEFQDTNPQQFSLLWRLRTAGVPALVVGDLKQAIMGFQGADPRLLEALIDQNKKKSVPLSANWRSQPALMDFINKVGPGLFGEAYGVLEPKADASPLAPLEFISYSKRARRDNHLVRGAWVGERVKDILGDTSLRIVDKRTQKLRGIQGRDIAILCQTHKVLEQYAEVLRAQGLRVRLEEDGWFESRAVQIAFYALSYVANPGDRHAALYMATTELGELGLEEGIRQLVEAGRVTDPILDKLDAVREGDICRNVYTLVADTLDALAFYDTVARWPDAVQARASLLRLQSEAQEFMTSNREARSAGGFYGDGVPSLLAWLSVKVAGKDKNRKPAPRVQDEAAIELVTWHASKGREWPIVVVGEMDRKVSPRLPTLDLGYKDFTELEHLLDKATLEYSPSFAAPEATERFALALQQTAEVEARRLLYVAITRAREKLIIEWPSYVEGKGVTPWSLLADECGLSLEGKSVTIADEQFAVENLLADNELPGDLELGAFADASGQSPVGRRAIERDQKTISLTPDAISPSTLDVAAGKAKGAQVIPFAPALKIDQEYAGAEFGTLMHRFFELGKASDALKQRQSAFARANELPQKLIDSIEDRVEAFELWLQNYFAPQAIARELPILSPTKQGSVMTGLVDLVIETAEGSWIIDHKSDQVEDSLAAFDKYQAQLGAYAGALSQAGKKVLGVGVHWVRKGEVVLKRD